MAYGFRNPENQRRRVRIACTRGTRRRSPTATSSTKQPVIGRAEAFPRRGGVFAEAPSRPAHTFRNDGYAKMRDGLAGPTTFTLIGGAPHASSVTHPSAVNAEIVNFLHRLAG